MIEEKPPITLHTSSGITGSFTLGEETTFTPPQRKVPSGECGYHAEHEP